MYHNINEICDKINIIQAKAETLRLHSVAVDGGKEEADLTVVQYQIDDIRALCADIANDADQ